MRELRAISFTHRELTAALVEFRARIRKPLPPGSVQDAVILDGPVMAATLPIVDDHGQQEEVLFHDAEIAAALVGYCMERRIRLPAKAEKIMHVISGNATLVIWLPVVPEGGRKPRSPRA